MNTFVRVLRYFTLLYDKMYIINVYHFFTLILEQGTVLCIIRFDPRQWHQRLFARCEEPFFCSVELTLQNTIYLLK